MKSLRNCVSPISHVFQGLAASLPLVLIFRPSFFEFALMLIVDTFAFLVMRYMDRMYVKLNTQDVSFFNGIRMDEFQDSSTEQKIQLYESMCTYPKRRALYAILVSFLKVIPGSLVILLVWQNSISHVAKIGILLGIYLVIFVYFYGAIYIESHLFLSNLIKDLHQRFNLKDVFDKIRIKNHTSEFRRQENLILFLLVLMILFLQSILILNHIGLTPVELTCGVVVVGALGMILFARIRYLGQCFVFGGFGELLSALNNVSYEKTEESLALHTDSLLSQFEMVFNNLVERLRQSENAMSSWVIHETHKSRYRALGEMSSLIAHDLTAPLHVIKFCLDSMREDPSLFQNTRYIENLTLNVERANELVTAMRARIKNKEGDQYSSSVSSTHKQILRLLETQFHAVDFHKVVFDIDPALTGISFKLAQSDLTHVLENLYRNSVTNLIQNKISHPRIVVRLLGVIEDVHKKEQLCRISVCDNGTGLSKARFEELTAYSYRSPVDRSHKASHRSMGLMLTRRLIEMNNGIMDLKEHILPSGTCFELALPQKITQ